MKKRVLSALMAVGLACSLVVTAFATADVSTTPAPTAAVESQNTETESSDPAAEADPTETPAETPAATQEPTPAPEESTPAPSEEPASSATPEPTAEPSAAPDDTVTATPTPTPEGTAAPTPEATEEPAAAEPTAEPEATAEPAADNSEDGIEYTAVLEQDGQALNVIVTAPADAFGEDVSLEVAAIENTDETDAIAAELDESGVTYDGFAALDISFKNAAGEEVEPSAPVTVRIELPDSIVDSGIDLNTLAVQHLAEDADGNVTKVEQVASVADGSIALSEEAQAAMEAQAAENAADDTATTDEAAGVAPMMLAANNALTDATAEAAAVAEFEVSGFSTFTITWSGSGNHTISVYLGEVVNGEVEELEVDQTISGATFGSNDTIKTFDAPDVNGYEYTATAYVVTTNRRGRIETNQIYDLRYESGWHGVWQYNTNQYYNDWQDYDSDSDKIYFIYQENSADISITDTIFENGSLTATLKDQDADVVSYTWYRATNTETDAGYEVVKGETENTLFVARDGARRYYYVEATLSDGKILKSAPFQVTYYDALQNGSFENPDLSEVDRGYQLSFRGSPFMQIPNGTEGLIWQTTGYGGHYGDQPDGYYTEIVKSTDGNSQGAYGISSAADGDQFAELNCETAGALYQDVLTVPGSTLYWGLEHADRTGGQASRLLVLISDTSELPENFDPTNYDEIESAGLKDDIQLDFTEYDVEWTYHSGTYVVPEGQYVTRFYFVAGNGSTEGNLLDNITFSADLPAPPAEKGNIVLNKAVTGIDSSTTSLDNVDFTFTVAADGQETQTVTLNAANNWTTILTVDPGQYTITENEPVQTIGEYTYQSTTISSGTTNGLTTTIDIAEKESELVVYTNTYEQEVDPGEVVSDPTIRKYVDDKGDGTYDLSLDVTGTTGKEEIPINVLYVLDESYSMMWTMDGDYPGTDAENPSGDNKYPEDENKQPIEGEPPYNYSYVRFNAAKQAIDRLNSVLKADENLDVQVALVTFAQDNENPDEYYQGKYISWKDLKTNILELPASEWETFASGTNYHDALTQAQNMISDLQNEREDAETIVVFVTDGEPNWPRQSGDGNYAKKQAAAAMAALDCDRFYAVGVGSDIGNVYLAELIQSAKEGIVTDSFQSGDTTALVNYFNGIAADIAGTDTHNVTIVDELSEYAELTRTTAIPQIEIQKDDGSPVTVHAPTTESKPGANGVVTYQYSFNDKTDASSTSETTQTLTYTYYPVNTYGENKDNAHPVITLDFPDEYALTKDWTYTITLPIRPTAAASTYLSEHNGTYPDTGAQDEETGIITDVPESSEDEWTSTGKAGFFSNTEATLTYDSNDTTGQEKIYLKPVIQVKNGSLTIQKVVEGLPSGSDSEVDSAEFTFTITGPAAAYNEQPDGGYSIEGASDKVTFSPDNSDDSATATVTITGDNSITIDGLPAGTYRVTEDTDSMGGIVNDYHFAEVTYAVNDDESNTVTLEAAGTGTVVATNRYEHNDVTLTVNKTVTGPMGDTSPENTFTFTLTTNEPISADDNPSLSNGVDVEGKYQYTFELAHNETIEIVVPYGVEATVWEEDRTDYTEQFRKYETPAKEGEGEIDEPFTTGNTVTIETMNTDYTVDFQNFRDVVPPTGLESNHTTPYGLMVGAAGVAGAALVGSVVVRRRRRRQE